MIISLSSQFEHTVEVIVPVFIVTYTTCAGILYIRSIRSHLAAQEEYDQAADVWENLHDMPAGDRGPLTVATDQMHRSQVPNWLSHVNPDATVTISLSGGLKRKAAE